MAVVLRFCFVLALMSTWVISRANPAGSLIPDYYLWTCPWAEDIVFTGVQRAVAQDARMAASFLRLHFHDCFVNTGGPYWLVQLGRRDSLTASKAAAENGLPSATSNISTLISNFQNVGLTKKDLVTLSGAHTIGKARCLEFKSRFMGLKPGRYPTLETEFLTSLQQLCSQGFVINNNTLATLDLRTPVTFDNQYYENLRSGEGLLDSDQVLYSNGGTTKELVEFYIQNPVAFFENFKTSMIKMGNIQPLTGTNGEIRRNCRFVNA